MKNVQTYLKELDREKLIDYFLERDPITYHKPVWADWIVSDVTEHCRKEISDFIDRLCNLEIKPSEDGEIGRAQRLNSSHPTTSRMPSSA